VGSGFAEFDGLRAPEIENLTVHPGPHKPFAFEFFEHIAKFTDFLLDHRGEHHDAGLGREGKDLVHDFLGAELKDGGASRGIVGLTDGSEKEPQIIVNLGGGGDCGPLVATRRALFDGDGGG
jgi:hypothetical protein